MREWGIEQVVRDSRIAMIYEGTNEIQAIDLLVRKVMADEGAGLARLLSRLAADLDGARLFDRQLRAAMDRLQSLTAAVCAAARGDAEQPYWIAGDYLRATALVLLGWAWCRIGASAAGAEPRWQAPRLAFERWVWPELALRLDIIESNSRETAAAA